MKMNASTGWIILIAIGAVAVAIGNINYNIAKDREKTEAAGTKALAMLRAECKSNLERVVHLRTAMENKAISTDSFQSTAWSVVSNGGLLVQMDQSVLEEITNTYYLVESAEKYRSAVLEMSAGMASVIGGIEGTRDNFKQRLTVILDQLEPRLKAIIERK